MNGPYGAKETPPILCPPKSLLNGNPKKVSDLQKSIFGQNPPSMFVDLSHGDSRLFKTKDPFAAITKINIEGVAVLVLLFVFESP